MRVVLLVAVALVCALAATGQSSDGPVVIRTNPMVGVYHIPLLEGKMTLAEYSQDRGFRPDILYRFASIDQDPAWIEDWLETCKTERVLPCLILYLAKPDPSVKIVLSAIRLNELKTKYTEPLTRWKKALAGHGIKVLLIPFSEVDNYLNPHSVKQADLDEQKAIRVYREVFCYVYGQISDPLIEVAQSVLARTPTDDRYAPYIVTDRSGALVGQAIEVVVYVTPIVSPANYPPIYDLSASIRASLKELARYRAPVIIRILVPESTNREAKASFLKKMPQQIKNLERQFGLRIKAILIHDASDNSSYALDSSAAAKQAAAAAIGNIRDGGR